MSGFKAILLTLATSAVVPMVVNAWSVAALAQSGDADTEQSTPSGSSPADEPVLLTPPPGVVWDEASNHEERDQTG